MKKTRPKQSLTRKLRPPNRAALFPPRGRPRTAAALDDGAPVGLLTWNRQGIILDANRPAAELLGIAQAKLAGRRLAACLEPDAAELFQRHRRNVIATGSRQHCDLPVNDAGGQPRVVRLVSVPLPPAQMAQCRSALIDVTEIQQAFREKEEGLALLDALFEAAPIGLSFWDRDLRLVRMNRALAEIHGQPPDAHLGKTVEELALNPKNVQKLARTWRLILETGGPVVNIEVSGESTAHPGQARCWIENWFPVKQGKQVIGIGTTVLDITARKGAERELKELNARLETLIAERTLTARRRAAQLQSLALELAQAEQRERQRLGGVLHDGLQQLLCAAQYELEFLEKHNPRLALEPSLPRLRERLTQALACCRSLNMELDPPLLRNNPLGAVLHWLGQWMLETRGLHVTVKIGKLPTVKEAVRVLMFQAARELLYDWAKHDRESTVTLRLRCDGGGSLRLELENIQSSGTPPRTSSRQLWGPGSALPSLRDRLEFVGGSLSVEPLFGRGLRIVILVPQTA